MSDTNLAPLFTYLDDKFASQNKRFDAFDEKFQTLQTSVDGLSKLVKDYQDEHILLRRKVEMLEAWAKQVSAKVGIPLPQTARRLITHTGDFLSNPTTI